MSVDARAKRASSVQVLAPYILAPPAPDGTIGAGDRQHIAWSYASLTVTADILGRVTVSDIFRGAITISDALRGAATVSDAIRGAITILDTSRGAAETDDAGVGAVSVGDSDNG